MSEFCEVQPAFPEELFFKAVTMNKYVYFYFQHRPTKISKCIFNSIMKTFLIIPYEDTGLS